MTINLPPKNPDTTHHGMGVILVVDDERAFCDVVCEILETIGYVAHHTLNATQALEKLPQIQPDVILTDVMMPDMDGLSFVRHLRQQHQWHSTPVVIISAKATAEDRRLALESGANEFLAKPFTAQDLEVLIADILNHTHH
jgi:CheY-like chemotaxis protein